MDRVHKGILKKFETLKGELIVGKKGIKGENSVDRLPPDTFVSEKHILHDLIRGFYKPAGKPYLLSYQATESEENYGKQIIWNDENESEFIRIEMAPPSSPKDNRKKSDINAARYNLENNIPIGILRKIEKGKNIILGIGMITTERADGVFIIEPFSFEQFKEEKIKMIESIIDIEDLNTSAVREVIQRKGQDKFKKMLLSKSDKCSLCRIDDPFLIASHIKPWSRCSDAERLDVNNGLLLCPNHDILFDRGYISFKEDGSLLLSPLLSATIIEEMGIISDIRLIMNSDQKKYMKWHEENQFKNN